MKKFFTRHLFPIVIVAAAAISIAAAVWYVGANHAPSFGATDAARGNVVASDDNAQLGFQAGGQIAHVYVAEGQQVAAGAPLADLSTTSLQAAC